MNRKFFCLNNAWELRERLPVVGIVALGKTIIDAKNVPKVDHRLAQVKGLSCDCPVVGMNNQLFGSDLFNQLVGHQLEEAESIRLVNFPNVGPHLPENP